MRGRTTSMNGENPAGEWLMLDEIRGRIEDRSEPFHWIVS